MAAENERSVKQMNLVKGAGPDYDLMPPHGHSFDSRDYLQVNGLYHQPNHQYHHYSRQDQTTLQLGYESLTFLLSFFWGQVDEVDTRPLIGGNANQHPLSLE